MVFGIIGWSVIPAINVMILGFLIHLRINKCCHYNPFQCPDSMRRHRLHRKSLPFLKAVLLVVYSRQRKLSCEGSIYLNTALI